MKYFVFLFCISFSFVCLYGQKDTSEVFEGDLKTSAYDEKIAEFPGGDSAFSKYVSNNIKYPLKCYEEGITGKVMVRFVVDTAGMIRDVIIVSRTGGCTEFESEAIRVIQNSPKWNPAIYKGKKLKSYRMVPIRFDLL